MEMFSAYGLQRRLTTLWVSAIVAAVVAVFYVPWKIPLAYAAVGESYALGFNNRAAVIGLGLVIVGLSAGMLLFARGGPALVDARSWFRKPEEIWTDVHNAETRIDLLVLGVASIAMSQFVLWWDSVLVVPYWGEADYFLSRIDLLALGAKPYTDFSFLYGPATLYVPLWLDRLSFGGLGLERAYAWTVVCSYVAGFVCNYAFLRCLALPTGWRPALLALCCIMWVPLTMGLQYTPLRFMAVPCVLALLLGTGSLTYSRPKMTWVQPAIAVGGTGLAFLLFPEMGVVCAVASIASAAVLCLRGNVKDGACLTLGVAGMVVLIHLSFPGYFHGMNAFVKGAMNFPIYPNLHNLLLVSVSLYVIATSGVTALLHVRDARAPFIAATAAANTVLLSPSLGRCDPGHVGFNSAMLFLTMCAASAAVGRKWFVAWVGTFAVAMVLLNQISYWNLYLGTFRQALAISEFYASHPQDVLAWHQAWEQRRKQQGVPAALNWRRTVPFPAWAMNDTLAEGISLPLGGDIGLDRFIKTQSRYIPPFHPPPKPDLHVPEDVERAASDARRQRIVMLPEQAFQAAKAGFAIDPVAYEMQTAHFLGSLMIFPIACRMKNPPLIPDIEVCRQFVADGEVVAIGAGYAIVRIRQP